MTANGTLYAYWTEIPVSSGGGSYKRLKTGNIEINQPENMIDGKIIVEDRLYREGETVKVEAISDKGYELKELVVLTEKGKTVEIKDNKNRKYEFTMPAGGVTVIPTFGKINYYYDILADDWFDNSAWFCAKEGLMSGPEIGMTREQLATMLYNFARYSDCELTLNEVTDFDAYRDESDISPYAREALLWACDRGIIRGITEADPKDMSAVFLFPLKGTNRGEIAAILERFVGLYPELFN